MSKRDSDAETAEDAKATTSQASTPAEAARAATAGCEGAPGGRRIPLGGHAGPVPGPREALLDAAFAYDCLARYAMSSCRPSLSKAQADIIMHIALFGPSSMTALARGLGVSKEHATRAVAALEEKGIVTKRRREDNRRVTEAVLTEQAQELTTSIRAAGVAQLDGPLSCLTPAERDELAALSARAAELLHKIRLE